MAPEAPSVDDAILLDSELFRRIETLHANRAQLDLEPRPVADGLVFEVTSFAPRVAWVPRSTVSTIERRGSIPGQEHLPPALLRVSVGIEDVEDLWTDLDRALRQAR